MSATNVDHDFEALLDYLKRSRGFDFSGYKRPSLIRRIQKRMQTLQVESYAGYTDYLEVHPQEFTHLFNTILINVTSFFRDAAAWEIVRDEVVPRIAASKGPDDPIRVWCAGAASGEEAYTAAMVMAEALGEAVANERVKIYATDVDEEALTQARQAIYTPRELEGIPPALLEKYFEPYNHRSLFRKELRRQVIFGRHDLVQDAPISRIDLLVCRNTLMYFNAEAQARILARFHFALGDGGYLFLGKAEMFFTQSHLFTPVDLKRRIFVKVPKVHLRDRLSVLAQSGSEEAANHLAKHVRFREAAFDSGPVAYLAVDLNGYLALGNERARELFALTHRDLGRPLQDLDLAYRIAGLRPGIEQAHTERHLINLSAIEWLTSSGDLRYLDFQIAPIIDPSGAPLGVSLHATDITTQKRLQDELHQASQELETAYEELQSTNEELETTNEELQSTIEELETTNEELQSTNEELETMNEELQSTNEELHTINEELRRRDHDLNQVNAFLASVLGSLRGGVAVLDRDLEVRVWNDRAQDMWGLRPEEVQGKNFHNLDIGLPVEHLLQPLRAAMAGAPQEVVLNAVNRRGRPIQCRVTCTALFGPGKESQGAILVMEELGAAPTG